MVTKEYKSIRDYTTKDKYLLLEFISIHNELVKINTYNDGTLISSEVID
jgi:hypothetical protein